VDHMEARLDLSRLYLETREFTLARTELDRVLELATEGGHGAQMARARALLARSHRESVHGDPALAQRLITEATAALASVNNQDFAWSIAFEACEQAISRGDMAASRRWAIQTLDGLQTLEDAVPGEYKASFRGVNNRARARRVAESLQANSPAAETPQGPARSASELLWHRLLETNKRLASERDVQRLLSYIMDSAILLSGAERGFVLLRSSTAADGVEIRVARNIDQENIRNTKLKISHSIAIRAMEDGESIVSVDAMEDTRYQHHLSVHNLKLRSVMCLPMRVMGRVLGAIYLDNRFQVGAFDGVMLTTMEAFSDQAGLALNNAQMVRDLQASKEALEGERTKVQALNVQLEAELQRTTDELEETHRVVVAQRHQLVNRHRYDSIIGDSEAIRKIFRVMDKMLENTIPVLISGESGTGKELVARAIHFSGKRSAQPFVAINCGAIPANLLESELFGHVRGAFTGANRDKKGLFEAAHQGTLFLDELGELPMEMQVKLLRVLQDGRVKKVGATDEVQVDVRIIAATNRELLKEIEGGRFREDLYYRLSVVPIELPPLRARPEDIPLLVDHFQAKNRAAGLGEVHGIRPKALALLNRYAWPGNIRQLEMVLKNVSLFCDRSELDVDDFRAFPDILKDEGSAELSGSLAGRSLAELERVAIIQTLKKMRGNKKKSAEVLGIDRRTLYNKLKAYGIVIEKELHVN
jgi:transcriptional regulator with GAF, ATPase, and Fis domain